MDGDNDAEADRNDAARLGARLRRLRRQQRLSLQEVETASGQEFKASVLGAYERGERTISVPRLQRLARVYRVPVGELVPSEEEQAGDAPDGDEAGAGDLPTVTGVRQHAEPPVTIDLAALARLARDEVELLSRYVRTIELQRGDYNGRMLTVRRGDLTAIACILGCRPDEVAGQLDSLGLRLNP
ncbi:MAG: transcriptional regulator [Acidimicrobiia bacterium]